MTTAKTMLVVGAGGSLGSAIARTFAADGFTVCVTRRNGDKLKPLVDEIERLGGKAIVFGSDARREDQVIALIDGIEREVGPLEAAVYNVGGNVRFGILETTSRVYSKVWEMGCFGGFLVGREVARRMVDRGRGTILFTGATASLRGGVGYAAFAGAKYGLRALAQSMARELGPKNIHVAHVVIDGPIDTPFTRERFPEIYTQRPPDGVLLPDDIAPNYLALHYQKRSAWTHELDLRSWIEPW
jgi:NAD(P)-dependent dehydrogenase (short-subunit alcohol dehydrogenase family)